MQHALHNPPLPKAADPQAAQRLRASFAALGAREAAFAASDSGGALLDSLGGNSPYLSDLACREPETLLACAEYGSQSASILTALSQLSPTLSHAQLAASLRQAKRQIALDIAIADLRGAWGLEQVTGALSELAEATLRAATRHLLRALHDQGKILLPYPDDPERDSGFVVFALGKLGARELNYSSDIDLVLIYDPDAPAYLPDSQGLMARLARDLTNLLSTRDANGYVFRVDLRLRPDPAATPPVMSLSAALTYYESHGRTWERAAFSKARAVAGDFALGQYFLSAIRPFIWRKYLDFTAISDIREMKRQIDTQHTTKTLLGFDVKLGRGGIREIEFIVQTLGLIWGGHDPALRIPATLKALPAMAKNGHLPETIATQLADDYRELRRVEHRLQMVADRQTHELPITTEALDRFCVFLNTPNFPESFSRLLARVHEQFLDFFNTSESSDSDIFHPGHDGVPPAAFTQRLHELGFTNDKHIAERLREWFSGEIPALRSPRARELLAKILPHLFFYFGKLQEPDKAFSQFDILLRRQSAGVQLLSLFAHNTALLKRLASVLGAAPALSDYLAETPQALESLLAPQARFVAPRPVLRRLLSEVEGLEQAVSTTRHFVRQEEFHLSVAMLEGRLNVDEAGALRSTLAQAALSQLLPLILASQKEKLGSVRGAKVAVVALGKAGSGEMLPDSDLDLMLLYEHSPTAIAPTRWFIRFSHNFVGALTAKGQGGPLYQVDMRLRPSGNAGPVAVSLAAFEAYHAHDSWTWERLALTRARVMAATPGFAQTIRTALLSALCRPERADKILTDTAAMRAKLMSEVKPRGPFDVRNIPGGMMDIGFITQALQLIHGPQDHNLFHPNTAKALRGLAAAGHLQKNDADSLIHADFLWRTIQGINRITGLSEKAHTPPASLAEPLLRLTGFETLSALQTVMADTAVHVHDIFTQIITKGATYEPQ